MEKLAVIRNVKFGVGDRGTVVLRFDTYVTENTAASQSLYPEDAINAIQAAGVDDVYKLNGRTCWVNEERAVIQFVRMADL